MWSLPGTQAEQLFFEGMVQGSGLVTQAGVHVLQLGQFVQKRFPLLSYMILTARTKMVITENYIQNLP